MKQRFKALFIFTGCSSYTQECAKEVDRFRQWVGENAYWELDPIIIQKEYTDIPFVAYDESKKQYGVSQEWMRQNVLFEGIKAGADGIFFGIEAKIWTPDDSGCIYGWRTIDMDGTFIVQFEASNEKTLAVDGVIYPAMYHWIQHEWCHIMEALSNIWTSEVVHGVHEGMDKAYGILAQGAAEGFKRRQTVLYKVTRLLAQIAILKWIVAILSVKSATAVTIEPLESEPVTHDYAKPNLRDLAEAMGAWETSNFDKTTLGMRNNNPTNLRWSPFATSYLETKNGRYAQFGTLEEGFRAAVWDLNKKATGQSTHVKPEDTVETLINVWCNGENYLTYSKFVGAELKIDPHIFRLNEFSQ